MAEKLPAPKPTPGDFQPLSQFELRIRNRILSQDLPGIPSAFLAWINRNQEMEPPKLIAADLSGIRGEEWHEVGGTGEPAFQNSWVNVGGAQETAAFYKDATGRVHLKGQVKSGTVGAFTPVFTLPAGYWPAKQLGFAVPSNNLFGQVDISAVGNVTVGVGSNVNCNLNVSFRAA